MSRLRCAALIVRPTARVLNWPALLAGAAIAFVVAALATRDRFLDLAGAVHVLRLAAIPLVVGVAFALDDPTEATMAGLPTPLALRRVVRLALVLPAVALSWFGLLLYVSRAPVLVESAGEMDVLTDLLPVWALTLEAAAMVAVALAVAALSARYSTDGTGGVVAAPTLLGMMAAALFLPARWQLWAAVSDGEVLWRQAHQHWAILLVAATALLAHASRDPWRAALPRLRRRAAGKRATRPHKVASVSVSVGGDVDRGKLTTGPPG